MTNEVHAVQPDSQLRVASDLITRPAAYSVIEELFRVQETMEPRSLFRRIFGSRPVHPDARSWFSGAIGELAVAELLAQLGSEWTVLHAVPVGAGDSDIDHVVLGPPGVFTINTKRHRGKKIWVGERMLLVAGQKTDHLRNSRHEAKRAAKVLTKATGFPVAVQPVLAIVESEPFSSVRGPQDVSIMDARALPRWLKRRPKVLETEALTTIVHAATDVRTWHPTAQLSSEPSLGVRFRALERADNHARVVRVAWMSVAAIAVALLAYNYVLPAISAAMVAGVGAL